MLRTSRMVWLPAALKDSEDVEGRKKAEDVGKQRWLNSSGSGR